MHEHVKAENKYPKTEYDNFKVDTQKKTEPNKHINHKLMAKHSLGYIRPRDEPNHFKSMTNLQILKPNPLKREM